ncbi:MAG: gamma-glutamyltransferase [Planctomycetes bacterium]|nr:gamma-glutamyltransferase [Planctomycetota bacterium]
MPSDCFLDKAIMKLTFYSCTLAALFFSTSTLIVRAESFSKGVVVSVSQPGSDAGLKILKSGGNAVDAAIATAFALAVTHPAAGNIGGGGFMVVHPPVGKGEPTIFEYRENAPKAAFETVFKKTDGMFTHKVSGVPGTVKGLALAHQRFGSKPWAELLIPAIELAEKGFPVSRQLANSLNGLLSTSKEFEELQRVFKPINGTNQWQTNDILVQKDLGKTLERIAKFGPDEFYLGATADLIHNEMKMGGGLIGKDDLALYQARERKPIKLEYKGFSIYGSPPPSSGAITLGLMLNMIEPIDIKKMGRWSPETFHLLIETMKRAFCERARHLGDQGFVDIPGTLLDKEFAKKLAASINPQKATPSADLANDFNISKESDSTTHFSIVDNKGMAVSNTYTLEQSYGSKVMVRGAGFLLNNEMLDFNWFPGETNKSGRIGTKANLIQPGKKMLSSQTPVIVAKNGSPYLVTGSPGSRTIINTVFNIIINVIDFEMTAQEAIDSARLHHQWFPDKTYFEGANNSKYEADMKKLRSMGHDISSRNQGDAHSILIDPKTKLLHPGLDHRIEGGLAGY